MEWVEKCFVYFPKLIYLDHCELLLLIREDFKNVLQASVQKQWDEVQNAMSAFTYFDAFDEVILAKVVLLITFKDFNKNIPKA